MRALGLIALGCAGCFLPVATGAPEPATTVGKGHWGAMASEEAPTLDLIAQTNSNEYTSTYGESPAAALRFTLSYGITDDTDIEAAAEGELWLYFLPLPTGGSIGLRHHLGGDSIDFAIAGRVGGVSADTTYNDSSGNSSTFKAEAEYAAVQAVAQVHRGFVRPLAAVNFMPFNITRTVDGSDLKFRGLASSVTFGVMLVGSRVQFGPYATVTNFISDQFSGGTFASGGLMLAIRPDRSRLPPPPPPRFAPPAPYAPYGPSLAPPSASPQLPPPNAPPPAPFPPPPPQ